MQPSYREGSCATTSSNCGGHNWVAAAAANDSTICRGGKGRLEPGGSSETRSKNDQGWTGPLGRNDGVREISYQAGRWEKAYVEISRGLECKHQVVEDTPGGKSRHGLAKRHDTSRPPAFRIRLEKYEARIAALERPVD